MATEAEEADSQSQFIPYWRPQTRHRNAHSKSITVAEGIDTYGALNQHPSEYGDYSVGVHDVQGSRATMEDAYSFVVDFAGIRGQGYFAIFDGHAGPEAAEWCGNHFHEQFLKDIQESPSLPIPDVLNKTFHSVDSHLSTLSQTKGSSSGCTAVTAFLRVEDENGRQVLTRSESPIEEESTTPDDASSEHQDVPSDKSQSGSVKKKSSGSKKIRNAVRSIVSSVSRSASPTHSTSNTPRSASPVSAGAVQAQELHAAPGSAPLRRVLYTANAGDARAVLCRAGKAVRLTYDHKGADRQEAKRIQDAGGFVLNNRVNGVLAVTRSLGDSSMKEFVVGSPYTTETVLGDTDEFLILACDGLWDVASDQKACDLIRDDQDAAHAAHVLTQYAIDEGTRDNVTTLVVRFNKRK
ncbi:protein phosphatase 2C [Sistotremastrum niveocremeum HHB9708]|uniref:Protein phosphatase 2C n=1 Tax=Sistotremastrum niveocremeum HHB9708 TaxID=1314777 RepID=A0A164ZVQ0_9AGAM|nr:protein phosphatase 2C [Sistotremastrum niveocremeum HHB9708]